MRKNDPPHLYGEGGFLLCYNMTSMDFELLTKYALNGLIQGSIYAMLALGLSLIYGVLRFANLAHGEYALIGAYAFYTFHVILGWPLIPSILLGIVVLFAVTIALQYLTFMPVKNAHPFILLVISIALGIFLKNLLLIIFQARSRLITNESVIYQITESISITQTQIIIILVAIASMIGLTVFLKKTKIGKAIRAVSDNREVTAVLGIPINRIITVTFLISSLLAGAAGILVAYDQNLHPNLGAFFTIKSFAAVILGGIGSVPGAVLGGYILGFAENIFIALPFVETNYKDAVAFFILIIVLYIKPTGLFGGKTEEIARH